LKALAVIECWAFLPGGTMNPVSGVSYRAGRAQHDDRPLIPPLEVVSLSNDRYSVRLSGAGTGYSECRGRTLTRWQPDRTCDVDGFHIYVRDLDDGFVWSAGYQPTRVAPSHYDFRCAGGVAEIVRLDRNIECRVSVRVSPEYDFEVRRCRITNFGDGARRIELTSYLEWVLGCRAADASHPAFSKLFVETQYDPRRGAIVAHRRPRHNDDSEFWGFHCVVGEAADRFRDGLQFETNRGRFIGRGRTLSRPRALAPGAALSGDWGAVLDPIASLRAGVSLGPGESQHVTFGLGAAESRSEIDELIELLASMGEFAPTELLADDGRSSAETDRNGGSLPPDGSSSGQRVVVHSAHRGSRRSFSDSEAISKPSTGGGCDGAPASQSETLQFDNGYGGFSADGREYVIRIRPGEAGPGKTGHQLPPAPWANVIANERAGFLVTESGAGYMWAGNSRLNRLTAWHNDPLSDPHSEAMWIRDEDAGVFWSPLSGPTPAAGAYRVRHGLGYTTFEHESHGLSQEITMFMDRDEPVKLTRIRLVNVSGRRRRLTLFSYLHWALGGLVAETSSEVVTEHDAEEQVIWATNPCREHYGGYTAFSAVRLDQESTGRVVAFTCDRSSVLGVGGDATSPTAITSGEELDRRAGSGLDPCAAWQVAIDLPANGTFECALVLGETADRAAAAKILANVRSAAQIDRSLGQVQQFWRDTLSAVTIETPDREIDLMVNGWLLYQTIGCRMWGRSAYYQPGGAFGFRDQLQDSAALVYHRPEMTRKQILRHAAQQFVEGDVLHWWHPDTGYGVRTRFSDDLLWLPFVATEYVQRTGDEAIFDEEIAFITAPPLADAQQEAYLRPSYSRASGSLYDHCCRALDRGLTSGEHGLPLIGCGDWNDGFSRIGRLGRGESVWLGFFIDYVLQRMLPICCDRGDDERVARYSAYRQRLRAALDTAGWDGAWYRRAYYDNGQPIGSATSDECQIDALAQAWAVISGVAPAEKASSALAAVESRLIDDRCGMIRLLAPAFDRTPNDPGYIKGYLPGIRENGGQYTHGVLWVVRAMAEMGRGTRAVELLKMLTPVWHTSTTERTNVYQTEPYVVAADVYGEPPHVGRGGWTWYTGSAGWMFRVAVESILGLSTDKGRRLVIDPSISSAWPECRLTYRLPDGTTYEITIENPSGNERGVKAATVDGRPADVLDGKALVPLARDGQRHLVVVRL
jgi:cyclic beta-1,2-glucan synthetase